MSKTCYACEMLATTVEHVPAKSFFPAGNRDNLITVPSCAAHNNDLAKDVEYVRNILPLVLGTNETGFSHLLNKILPSFEHSPSLKERTFRDLRAIDYNGQPAGIFTVDLARLNRVMVGILRALHFRDTGEKHEEWAVIPVSMMHRPSTPPDVLATWSNLINIFGMIQLIDRKTNNEQVFRYSSASNPSPKVGTFWFYEMTFYDGFVVKAFTLRKAPAGQPSSTPVEV